MGGLGTGKLCIGIGQAMLPGAMADNLGGAIQDGGSGFRCV